MRFLMLALGCFLVLLVGAPWAQQITPLAFNPAAVAITGGSISGVSGSFTTLAASGAVSFANNTAINIKDNGGTDRIALFATTGNILLVRPTAATGSVALQNFAGTTQLSTSGAAGGGVTVGDAALTTVKGEVGMTKITASGSAPGAAGGKFELVCGTNAGTAKLIVYAGTSTTPVTITDNIGSGVTGC